MDNDYFTKYDYALISLKTSFNMSLPYINSICLPNKLMDIWENPHTNYSVEYTVTGFGLTNFSHTPNYLHFATVINYPPRKIFRVPINHMPLPRAKKVQFSKFSNLSNQTNFSLFKIQLMVFAQAQKVSLIFLGWVTLAVFQE